MNDYMLFYYLKLLKFRSFSSPPHFTFGTLFFGGGGGVAEPGFDRYPLSHFQLDCLSDPSGSLGPIHSPAAFWDTSQVPDKVQQSGCTVGIRL